MVSCALYCISPKARDAPPLVRERIAALKEEMPEGDSPLVIAIGGDGEVLNAFHAHPDRTILGVKIDDGHSLGYYSAINLQDIDHHSIEKLQEDQYHTTRLPLLSCSIGTEQHTVLNEASIHRALSGKSGDFTARIGDDTMRVQGDGILLCTPGGSTGYTFSTGGPLISWDLYAYGIRFFNISRGFRSISSIVPGDTRTTITARYNAHIEIDGNGRPLPRDTPVTVQMTGQYASIAGFQPHSQLDRFKRMARTNTLEA